MSAIVRDIEHEVYRRQRDARHRMVAACRRIPAHEATPPAREDTVIEVANLTPDGTGIVSLTPAEQRIAAMLERRADAAIAQIRAEHQRMRAAMRGGRR